MDWNKTKSIFIASFLILNVFLTWQLVETKNANQLSVITEATIQEQLKQNNVTIDVELPEEENVGVHIIGKSSVFTDRIISDLFNQEVTVVDDHFLFSILNRPYQLDLNEDFMPNLNDFLGTFIYKGDEYRFGRFDQETNKIYFYQTYNDKLAYTLDAEPLILQLNEQGQIVSYQQYYLEFEELDGREREMLSSLKALEILLTEQLIGINDTITSIELGYYSFFSPQGDTQVFAPMWQIGVNDEQYLVNAIEGTVQHLT